MSYPDDRPDYFVDTDDEQPAPAPAAPSTPTTPVPKRRSPWRRRMTVALLILLCVLGTALYIRYWVPYADDAQVTGYVTNVERRGIIFRTYEGEMITESALTDTTRVYSRDFAFTIPDRELALKLRSLQGTGRKVTLLYRRYYGALPWRGASINVVTELVDNTENEGLLKKN